MPHKDTLLSRNSFSSARSSPCSNDADMAGKIQAPEGHHDVETNMFVPQSPQGEEDSGPGRNCRGFEDTQGLETAVCPPLLPMAPWGSQVCLCSEGEGLLSSPSVLPPTLNKITCILAERCHILFISHRCHILFISFCSRCGPPPPHHLPVLTSLCSENQLTEVVTFCVSATLPGRGSQLHLMRL